MNIFQTTPKVNAIGYSNYVIVQKKAYFIV